MIDWFTIDGFTNYRTHYGYPTREALWAEFWWRLEHLPLVGRLRLPYQKRKQWERRGFGKRVTS